MTQRKWRSFSSRRQQSGSKTWPATRGTWSPSLLSTQPGTAPGAAPRRAGRSRQVGDPRLASKHRLGDDQLVTGQWLREMGGCRRELVFRFTFRMGQYIVMVLERGEKDIKELDHVGKGAVQQKRDWTGGRASPRTRWPRMKLPVGGFLASAVTSENLQELISISWEFPKQSCEIIIVLFTTPPFFWSWISRPCQADCLCAEHDPGGSAPAQGEGSALGGGYEEEVCTWGSFPSMSYLLALEIQLCSWATAVFGTGWVSDWSWGVWIQLTTPILSLFPLDGQMKQSFIIYIYLSD